MPNAKIGITRFVATYDIRDVQGGSFCTPLGQTFPLGLSYRKSCKGGFGRRLPRYRGRPAGGKAML